MQPAFAGCLRFDRQTQKLSTIARPEKIVIRVGKLPRAIAAGIEASKARGAGEFRVLKPEQMKDRQQFKKPCGLDNTLSKLDQRERAELRNLLAKGLSTDP